VLKYSRVGWPSPKSKSITICGLQGLLGGMWPVSVMEKGLLVVWARMANNGPCASGQKPGFA
jgi:hypothetical protein